MEHEIAHGNDLSQCNDSLGGEDFSEKAAEHALKQNALNRQLLDLNKVLVQKEELAKAMASSDEKFQASARHLIWLNEAYTECWPKLFVGGVRYFTQPAVLISVILLELSP